MNDIVAHTLSAYTSAFEAATSANDSDRSLNLCTNTFPVVDTTPPLPLSVMVIKDTSNVGLSSTKHRGRVSTSIKRRPLKKSLSVRWKDQADGENTCSADLSEEEIVTNDNEGEPTTCQKKNTNNKPKKRSPSPPHIDIKEYEMRMKKLKVSIGDACKSELKLLNQAKHVREKRNRLVERLKHMKRKIQRFTVLNAQRDTTANDMDISKDNATDDDDNFILPPVFVEKSNKQSSSNYVDMTQ
jgi:hypothetical protein